MARTKTVHHSRQDHVGLLRRVEHLGMSNARKGSKVGLYLGTGLWTLRTVRRLADRREEILISEPLRPGERIMIANNRPTLESSPSKPLKGRRAKKAYRKAQKRAAAGSALEKTPQKNSARMNGSTPIRPACPARTAC